MSATFKFSFFFISFCTIIVAGDEKCSQSTCGREVEVQFPFTLQGHQDRSCGYPGFNLSCDNETTETLLDLGMMGKFSVRSIDYMTQEVQLYDKDDCLPRRLMNFDLTGTPFKGYNYQSFNFYNCSPNLTLAFVRPISCLSTPNYTVYAAPFFGSRLRVLSNACHIFASGIVPVWGPYDRVLYLADIFADLHLLWEAPNCGDCVARGGNCRFKNRNKDEIGCYNLPGRVGLSKVAKYVLGVGIGVPVLLFVSLVVCYMSRRFKSYRRNSLRHTELSASVLPEPPIFIVGLDESVIQSYPKVVLGESRRLVKPEDNICPICLSEYRAKDTLKTIPDCKHCFHAACIDQWLRRNVTCPICRKAPMHINAPVPAQVPVPVSDPV